MEQDGTWPGFINLPVSNYQRESKHEVVSAKKKGEWWFPEIGVPPVIIHFSGIFHHKQLWGTPMDMETPK